MKKFDLENYENRKHKMSIEKEKFGETKDGKKITKYKLFNNNNSYVGLINFGGIITEIYVPDKNGNIENVVLNFDNIKDYEKNIAFFGALIGRTSGRISSGEFTIDGIEYKLFKNDGNNNLHGGPKGFSYMVWDAKEIKEKDFVGIELSFLSPDADQNFPGNLFVKALYTFNDKNELKISYEATTDKNTIVNLTNHSYFNLSGTKEDICSHKLKINSDYFACIDKESLPTGEKRSVIDTPFDFMTEKMIGKDIDNPDEQIKNGNGYDHPFILNKGETPQISAIHEKSGRTLEITTEQAVVVFYSGNSRETSKRLGFCLETQDYPDAINQENFPTYILRPGDVYKTSTIYRFNIL